MVVGRKGQPAGKEEDSETSDENGSSPVPKSVCVVSGRQHHRLRMLVDNLMCRDGRSDGTTTPLLESSSSVQSAHSIWSKTSKSTEPWLRIRKITLSGEFSITMVHSFLLRGGSLPLWDQNTSEVHRCSKELRQLTLARTQRAMPAPVWEGIATQLALHNHLHRAAFILVPTCVRQSFWQFPKLEYLPRQESAMGQSLWISAGFTGSTCSCTD